MKWATSGRFETTEGSCQSKPVASPQSSRKNTAIGCSLNIKVHITGVSGEIAGS